MSLTNVLLLFFVIAKPSDEIVGRSSDLLVEAWLSIVKTDGEGSYISGLTCKEDIGTSRPLWVETIHGETELSSWDMPSV